MIRHGETAWNAARRLQGHIDIALNQEGQRQADAMGQALSQEALAVIVASDLQRARHTAQALAQHHGLPVQSDAGLRERCYGAFEGLLYAQIAQRYPSHYAAWQAREIDAVMPAGERESETLRQFYQRSTTAILGWARKYPGQTIAMVAHGGVLECAYRAALDLPLDRPRDFPVKNASINRFSVIDGKLKLIDWGDCAHLAAPAIDELA